MQSSPIALPDKLRRQLLAGMDACKIVFIQAGPGWGKTTAVRRLLDPCQPRLISLARQSLPAYITRHSTVVLDDLQALPVSSEGKLAEFLYRSPENQRFVLLSRAPLPSSLALFTATGTIQILGEAELALDTQAISELAAQKHLTLTMKDIRRIQEESRGNPSAVVSLLNALSAGFPLQQQTIEEALNRVGAYLDKTCLTRLGPDTALLLTQLACLPSFDGELAAHLSDRADASEVLELAGRVSGLIRRQEDESWQFPPEQFLAPYLQKKARVILPPEKIRTLFLTGGRWYLRRGDIQHALNCFQQTGHREDLLDALIHFAESHPDAGAYTELRPFFLLLTEQEIHSSAYLLCTMSLLCAASLDVAGTEKWHQALLARLEKIDRHNEDYPRIKGLAAYLSLVLPSSDTRELEPALTAASGLLAAHEAVIPEISLTNCLPSLLRGGKDLSSWASRGPAFLDEIYKQGREVLGRHGLGLSHLLFMEYQLETGADLSEHLLSMDLLRKDLHSRGVKETEFVLVSILVWTLCASGRIDQATDLLIDFRAEAEKEKILRLLPNIDALHCRISLMGDGKFSDLWFTGQASREIPFFTAEYYLYLALTRCYIQREDFCAALLLLGKILSYTRAYKRTLDEIEVLLLAAICRFRMGGPDWSNLFNQALSLGEKSGYVAVFAREGAALLPLAEQIHYSGAQPGYWRRILNAVVVTAGYYQNYLQPLPRIAYPLTETEKLILRLLCQRKSTGEICTLLKIKLPTAKTHLHNIYKKLGVQNRADAVKAAVDLRLLR